MIFNILCKILKVRLLDKIDIVKITNISKAAGKRILEVYNSHDFNVEMKDDHSPLTRADKDSNQIIIEELKLAFPKIPILSEEEKEVEYDIRKDWRQFWCIDPLDGTKEFIKRNGEFTVNIALIENNIPVFGVIYVPISEELFYGGKVYGSYKLNSDSEPIKLEVSSKTKKDNLNVVQSRSHSGEEENKFYSNFNINNKLSKGSSLKICLIAEGLAEIYYRSGPTWEWDTAAGHAILLGAGGYFINKDGSEIVYNKKIIKNFGFIASSISL